jgi:hypothetical protein
MAITATKLKETNNNGEDLYFIEETKIVKVRQPDGTLADEEKKYHDCFSKEKLQAEKADLQTRITEINALLAKMV